MDRTAIEQLARAQGCTVQIDTPLKNYTSFRIGGPATLLITPHSAEAAAATLKLLWEQNVSVTVIGNGSNLLVSDRGVDGVVMRIGGSETPPTRKGTHILCDAALPLKVLCRFAREQGLKGLEPLYGIPGTVGGAVYMNAGAYGGEVADTLYGVTVASQSGELIERRAEELALRYRHSTLMQSGEVVLRAEFELTPDEPAAIGARMEDYMMRRREKQPLEYPSAGSFFKRPEGHFAGALIEQSGLKGTCVGDAQVSEKHAGFLINRGSATCCDVKALMKQIQETVWQDHGVMLEPEVQFLGEE